MSEIVQPTVDAFNIGGLFALAATGIALIYGVMRLMNFAHGEVVMVGAYGLLVVSGAPWPILIVATLGVTALVAMAMERIAYRPVRGASEETLLVTSFALAATLQNVVILIVGSRPRSVGIFPGLAESVEIGGLSIGLVDVATAGTAVLALVVLGVILNRTLWGLQLRAASENFNVARLLGVKANRTILLAFGMSGLLAGTVSLLLVARTGSLSPTMGLAPIIWGFLGVIIGGMGSISGAMAGGFLVGVTQVALQELLPPELRPYRDAFLFGAVICVIVLRPQGLFPPRGTVERV